MSHYLAVLFVTLLSAISSIQAGSDWTYGDEEHWGPLCKTGHEQSPIALYQGVSQESHFEPLFFKNYESFFLAYLKNNGHSAEVRLHVAEEGKPQVEGGNLNYRYILDHLHFHWQSEHTIEGYRFPLELHLVHYADVYKNLSTALNYRHGVAVFGVLFELSPDDDIDFKPLLNIMDNLKDHVDQPLPMDSFSVKNFLPRDTAGYFRYEGSLTTPQCNEGILWTIFTNTIRISSQQVKVFEAMHTPHNTQLLKNYRSLQPLNERVLKIRISPIRNGGISLQASIFLLLPIVLPNFIRLF